MKTFTVNYTVKFELSTNTNYVWNEFNECFNLKTGRRIKQTIKNGMIGLCIDGKFCSLKSIRQNIRRPKVEFCPF